jgi:hypothetical protein
MGIVRLNRYTCVSSVFGRTETVVRVGEGCVRVATCHTCLTYDQHSGRDSGESATERFCHDVSSFGSAIPRHGGVLSRNAAHIQKGRAGVTHNVYNRRKNAVDP